MSAAVQPDVALRHYGIRVMFQTEHSLTQDQASRFWAAGRRFQSMNIPKLHFYRWEFDIDTTDAVEAANQTEHAIESIVQFGVDITGLEIRDLTGGGFL